MKDVRGYSVIALDNIKSVPNLGSAMRAAQVYGAALVLIGGPRMARLGKIATDTMKAYRHVPVICVDDVMDNIPHDCVPVAVELVDDARALPAYTHPERAFYIFGAEDQTLGRRVLDRCRDKVMIPTRGCMNLAATVNVVLYDRLCKRGVAQSVEQRPLKPRVAGSIPAAPAPLGESTETETQA